MNNLRTPFTLLVIVVLALITWFVWAHEQVVVPPAPQTQTATTAPATTTVQPATTSAPALDPATVAQTIVGSWQSTDDPNYSVAITADGTWTDTYAGANASAGTSQTGTYELFTSQNPDKDFTGVLVPGVVYVKVSEGSSTYYFSVLEANGSNLQLNYLDRDVTLSFAKIQ